ncbi:MAG: DUF5777 family beta-barrel protein [Bacteroidetes bacterium]|nr:DUF5777 family beta-barrel protein [Bacteroidota bacterium]
MKKLLFGLVFFITGSGIVSAQDSIPAETKKPLEKAPFESGYFIDDQTVSLPPAHTLQLVLQHRFGTIQNHFSDMFGIWGSSNIRFGLDYTITKNLLVGIGETKNKLMTDFQIKYTFIRQQKGGFPLTIAVYGDMGIDGRKSDAFGTEFKNRDRFSYFGELMIARRFCKMFSAQVGLAWVHYNIVDSSDARSKRDDHVNSWYNSNIQLSGIGRLKVSPQTSIIATYSQCLLTYTNTMPWPNAGLGVEISTSTHTFQIYLAAANGIVPQEVAFYNDKNPYNGAILIGFNITRLWTF